MYKISTLYVSLPALMAAGFATEAYVLGIVATGGLVAYIRCERFVHPHSNRVDRP
jgi:hypothetical protein